MASWVALDGQEAESCVGDALERVCGALSYLRAATGPVAEAVTPGTLVGDGRWMKCDELLADPELVAEALAERAARTAQFPDA